MSETKEKPAPTLQERLDAAIARAEKAEKKGEKLEGKVKDLSDELKVKEATAPANSLPTVKVAGTHYQFVSPRFKVGKGVVVTAADAAKDEALCAELVAKKSGVLKAVNIK